MCNNKFLLFSLLNMRFVRLLCALRDWHFSPNSCLARTRECTYPRETDDRNVERDTAIYFANYFGESIFAHLLWGPRPLSALHTTHDARSLNDVIDSRASRDRGEYRKTRAAPGRIRCRNKLFGAAVLNESVRCDTCKRIWMWNR